MERSKRKNDQRTTGLIGIGRPTAPLAKPIKPEKTVGQTQSRWEDDGGAPGKKDVHSKP